ncbi:MAG: glycerol-3-phosphate 1-O-acyltransferase PlsY [Ardenticatenaceae bacterium]
MIIEILLAIALGYLIGSFPTGYLMAWYVAGVDVRTIGSGRTGGTNVYRAAGRNAGLITAFVDTFKGVLPVVLARFIWGGNPEVAAITVALAAFFAIIGHNHSIFLGFRGGAGSMTAGGALLGLDFVFALLCAPIPFTFVYITRMTSIGSLLASSMTLLLGCVLIWQTYLPWQYIFFCLPFFLISWNTHRPNIARLRAGTERRLGERRK